MPKTLKKVLIGVLIAAAVLGAIWGGLVIYRNTQKKPVGVYDVSTIAMTDYWGDSSETYGMVTTEGIQAVMISDTQKVREIFVSEGQTVKAGDPLLAYDTTLSDIDLEKAKLSLAKLELQKKNAEKELDRIKAMRPYSSVLIIPESTGIQYIPQPTPSYLQGTGTEGDPLYYLFGANDTLSPSMLSELFPAKPEQPEPGDERNYDELYVVFVTREYDALNAQITDYFGLRLDRSSGELKFRLYDAVIPAEMEWYEKEPEPYYEESGSMYSAAELAQMRNEKEHEIEDLTLSIKVASVDLERLQQEVSDGVILSKIDGTVKFVRDPDEAYMESKAVVEVSGGGGYYIDVAMNEMELDTVTVGQTVTVNSWNNGMTYEGTIVEVSDYPTKNANSWSNGNQNVSYYPFRVFVDDTAEMQEYDYVSVTYQSANLPMSGFYLEKMYIRSEGGKSYVYVRGEDGLLEQRTVQTGKDLWGSYTEIRGGLELTDWIAFPYGKDVESGAKTNESTVDELYSSAY